jgi:3-hydroxybutyryl-CoA dehydratase
MNELGGYVFADLRVGMCARFAKTVREADIVLFAAVSGDNNVIHGRHHFQGPYCPWNAVGKCNLRGDRQQAARSGQHLRVASLRFRAPVRADDTVRATVTVKEMIPVRFRVLLATVCTVGGLVVIEGGALVALPAPSPPEYLSPVAFEKEAAFA